MAGARWLFFFSVLSTFIPGGGGLGGGTSRFEATPVRAPVFQCQCALLLSSLLSSRPIDLGRASPPSASVRPAISFGLCCSWAPGASASPSLSFSAHVRAANAARSAHAPRYHQRLPDGSRRGDAPEPLALHRRGVRRPRWRWRARSFRTPPPAPPHAPAQPAPRCAALTPPSARCPLQWNRSDTDRWKEGLWSRDRLIKKGYIKQ